jgi:sulfate transport system ATP-binding protein
MGIAVRNVVKKFASITALDHLSLDFPEGSLLALLGPSGCGKTTLLRVLAGLEQLDSGVVHLDEEEVTNLPPGERNFGFVFQHYALFKHMTVAANIGFPLRVRKWNAAETRKRTEELLQLVRLNGMGDRLPSQLSGGQRQRVALARALAAKPRILLLDEPFGALDARVRAELRHWLRNLHDEFPVTTVFVTHDQEEAFEVADRVVVMNRGRIDQQGTPQSLFDQPATPFVMDFLGQVNVFPSLVQGGRALLGGLEFDLPGNPTEGKHPVFVRPHELEISVDPAGPGLQAVIRHFSPAGSIFRVFATVGEWGQEIQVDLPTDRFLESGIFKGTTVRVIPKQVRVFEPEYAI